MSASANALLSAIQSRLTADTAMVALIGPSGFSDRLRPKTDLPTLVLSSMETRDLSTDSDLSDEHILTFQVWSGAAGGRQAQEVVLRLRMLLHDAPLVLSGFALVCLLHRASRIGRERGERHHVAEITFRAVTE